MREEQGSVNSQPSTQKGPAVLMEPYCIGWEQLNLNMMCGLFLVLCFLNLKQNLLRSWEMHVLVVWGGAQEACSFDTESGSIHLTCPSSYISPFPRLFCLFHLETVQLIWVKPPAQGSAALGS